MGFGFIRRDWSRFIGGYGIVEPHLVQAVLQEHVSAMLVAVADRLAPGGRLTSDTLA